MSTMKKSLLVVITIVLACCQSTHIQDRLYKVSDSNVELGAVGYAYSPDNLRHRFDIKSIPVLDTKVRIAIQVLPFTQDINKIYLTKMKAKGEEPVFKYTDSIPQKPSYVTLSLLDIGTYVSALNGDSNKELYQYLVKTENTSVVTGLAIVPDASLIAKLKAADAYYLVYNRDRKYNLSCYKEGKRTEDIDLSKFETLAYATGHLCWFEDERGRWKVGDVVKSTESCRGRMKSEVKDKEDINLFKM